MAPKKVPRKELLKTQDEFITFSARLLQFVIRYKLQVSCIFGGIIALIIIFSGIRYFSNKAEINAFALLQKGIIKYETELKENGPQKAFQKVQQDFQFILNKYPRKEGGKLARVMYANICFNAGDFEQSIVLYKKALENFDNNDVLTNFILSGLGYNHESKKDYQTAAMYFEKIVSTPDAIMKDEALFNLGRLYALMGKSAKSIESYNKIVTEYPKSIYYDLAKEKISG